MINSKDISLPEGWKWKKLGQIANIISGQSPPGDTYRKTPDGLPFFQGKADFGQRYPVATSWCIEPKKIAQQGDILISVRAPVGPTNVADRECCIGRGLAAIRCNDDTDQDFILFALKMFESNISVKGSGSTFNAINREDLLALETPVPPLPEQKRIAAILTEQLAAVEKAKKASEARLEAARVLPAAYLREVFESEESQSWQEVTLGEIALEVQNGIYKSAEFYGEGVPFLRMYNVENTSWHINQNNLAKVIIDANEQSKFELKKGDLLISRVNSHELVGKCAWVTNEEESYVFENMLIRVRLSNDVDSKFVAQQLSTKALKEQIQGKAKRAIGQSSINSTDIKQIKIRLPSLKTQSILAGQLENDVSHSHQLHKFLKEEYRAVVEMPMALLKQAFSGAL